VEGLQWDVVPVPRGPSGRFTRMAGAGVGIHPASKNKPLAWEYLKFPGSAEAYQLTKDTTYSLPPVKAAAEADWYLAWVPSDVRKVWVETFEYGRVQAHHLKWQELMEGEGARKHYTEALNGQRSVSDALAAIKHHADAVLG